LVLIGAAAKTTLLQIPDRYPRGRKQLIVREPNSTKPLGAYGVRTVVTFLLASLAGQEVVAVQAQRAVHPHPSLQWRTPHLLFVVCAPGGRRTCHDRMSASWVGAVRLQLDEKNILVVQLRLHHIRLLVRQSVSKYEITSRRAGGWPSRIALDIQYSTLSRSSFT
jgi:hypothetical protein